MATLRRAALALLALAHLLGIPGAPVAASLHLFQQGATAHQNFHVVWEACKYGSASLFGLALTLGPVARGERWAIWVVGAGNVTLFGGVFLAHAMTQGGPVIDFWSYGSFLAMTLVALPIVARLPPAGR